MQRHSGVGVKGPSARCTVSPRVNSSDNVTLSYINLNGLLIKNLNIHIVNKFSLIIRLTAV